MHQAAFKKGLRPTRRSWLCSTRCGHASGSTTMAPRANRRVLITPLVGTGPWASTMPLHGSVTFAMARERRW